MKAETEAAVESEFDNLVVPITRLAVVDIYGTMLFEDDPENAVPLRPGFIMWAERLHHVKVEIVAGTDNGRGVSIQDLKAVFHPLNPHDYLREVYELKMRPKDLSKIIKIHKVEPPQVLMVGNDEFNDLSGAKALGCRTFLVPTYNSLTDDFDFDSIPIL